MKYYHVTAAFRLSSINRHGLRADMASGKRQAVWFVEEDKLQWALLHCSKRHWCPIGELVILEVSFPDERPTHHGAGLYYFSGNVSPKRIVATRSAMDWIGADPA